MARNIQKNAKRANKANPREDRNAPRDSRFFQDSHSNVTELHPKRTTKKKLELFPRNIAQEDYVEVLEDDSVRIILAIGSAGTGKTMLATIKGLQGLADGTYEKLIVCRPNVGLDGHDLGFLPGTLLQKLEVWCLPVLDTIKEYYSPQQVTKMLEDETVELISMSHLRGRNLKNSFVILDEAQNLTPDAMKTILTRVAEGSRLVCTGDLKQVDRKYEKNGLQDFATRLESYRGDAIAVCRFGREHVERDPIVEEVLRIYGEE